MKRTRTLVAVMLLLAFASNKGMAQVIFTETFGQSTVRQTSPYMPSASYAWADPNGNTNQQQIENDYYAVIAPANIRDAWPAPGWWFWTGPEPTGNTWGGMNNASSPNGNTDHTGDPDGAVLVVNAGSTLKGFYSRSATLTPGNSYRLSFWLYLVNPSSMIGLQVIDPSTQTVLGSVNSAFLSTTGSWQEVVYDFQFPASCSGSNVVQVYLANALSNNAGNDYYIDDVSLVTLATPAADIIVCPSVLTLLANNGMKLTAGANGKTVDLSWTLNSAPGFTSYELQRSNSSIDFGTIHIKKASAAGIAGTFSYSDVSYNGVTAGIPASLYYRVKAVRADGSFEYSEVLAVSLKNNNSNNLVVYPQPAAAMSPVTISWNNTAAARVDIFDMSGALVSKAADIRGGRYTTGGLRSGMYVVKVTGQSGGGVVTRKIMVL